MSDYTDTIHAPGISVRMAIHSEYDWHKLGEVLAGSFDHEQADLLESFAHNLRRAWIAGGLMQIQYISDWLKTPSDGEYTYDLDALRWFLRELLIRLEEDA